MRGASEDRTSNRCVAHASAVGDPIVRCLVCALRPFATAPRSSHRPSLWLRSPLFSQAILCWFLMQAENRAYIPAIIYRADRCEPRDVSALRIVLGHVAAPQPPSEELRRWGWVLTHNIALSEFNERPEPTPAVLEAIRENAIASRDVTALFQVHLGRWPTYTDPLSEQWATTTTPLLMLSGGLDPATILRKARAFRPHFTGANQHWVELPTAGHTTFASSAFVDERGERRSCGMRMIMSFIENPTAPLDQSCVSRIEPIDYRINRPDFTRALLGTTDPWE